MTFNAVLALIGLTLVGATMAAAPTLPPDVPWYVHTILSGVQGAAVAALLIVDPKDLARLRPTETVAVVAATAPVTVAPQTTA